MLLTKGERGIGLLTTAATDAVLAELKKQLGEPLEMRHSLASGYVRKGCNYIAHYNGRFGVGITIRYHNGDSTRYCNKCTYIWDVGKNGDSTRYCNKCAYIWDVGKNVIGEVIERCKVTF